MITVDTNIKEVTKGLTRIQKRVIPQANSTALNKTMRTAVKEIKKDVAKDTGLKQKDIAERIKVRKSNKITQSTTMQMFGRYFNLIRFKARQFKKGVKAKAWGKLKLYKGAFIAKAPSGQELVFARKGKSRLPIKALAGASPETEATKRMDDPSFNRRVLGWFDKNFTHEVMYRIKRQFK